MHRDLHPGNIIKNGNKWMILDLGFSKMVCERQEKYKSTNLGAIVVKAP
jgi:predicted unusual protein kinase regulating ubiquinone biosynthesis (AarF/ABC1/UbiB family)